MARRASLIHDLNDNHDLADRLLSEETEDRYGYTARSSHPRPSPNTFPPKKEPLVETKDGVPTSKCVSKTTSSAR